MKCKTCGQEVRELKVGDRVEAIGEVAGVNLGGKRGVVKEVGIDKRPPVLVEFDKRFPKGHGGNKPERCKDGHGRYGEHEDFRVIAAKKKGGK